MAIIVNECTDEQVSLYSKHTFGRYPNGSHTVLTNPDASRLHAVIKWAGEHWSLQDSSTNGTFVNGIRINIGLKIRLNEGDKIHFGNKKANTWRLLDIGPPLSMLEPVTPNLPAITLNKIVALPSDSFPEMLVYLSPERKWVCENKSGVSVLKSGDCVGTPLKVWRFVESEFFAQEDGDSSHSINANSVQCRFNIDAMEENIHVSLKIARQELDLGLRSHHLLLLLLARKRLEDKTAGVPLEEQGWINRNQLEKQLKLSETQINIQIYQIKKQVIDTSPKSLIFPQVVERRTREIRFAYDDVQINTESSVAPIPETVSSQAIERL